MTAETAQNDAPDVQIAMLDIMDPAFRLDTPEAIAAREAHWYARTQFGAVVLRYAEAGELLKDRRLVQQGLSLLAMQGVTEGGLVDFCREGLLFIEDEKHTRLRKLISQAFTPKRLEQLRPRMRQIADELIDEIPSSRCEFMSAFADRYPIRVFAALLDLPEQDCTELGRWVDDLGLMFAIPVAPHLPAIEDALRNLFAYTDELVRHRGAAPGDDLVSALIAAEADGSRLDAAELRAMVVMLLLGGHDTARCQFGLAVQTFATYPDQWALLADKPELAAAAVEEVFRFAPNVPGVYRWVREEFTYRDLTLPVGAMLMMAVALANTDPRVYGEGDFDITAERPPQLIFGGGPHYCVGAQLARLEMREALPILARRLPQIAMAGEAPQRPYLGITGPYTLPISFSSFS